MARIRYIKPEIGTDEGLAEVSIAARYLFAMLPTHCDRDGRLEDSPKRLKLVTFPWDDVDVDALLSELAPRFIVRYEVSGKRFLEVIGFKRHQRPHPNEFSSKIPAPPTVKIKLNSKSCNLHDKKLNLTASFVIKGEEGLGTGEEEDIAAAPPVAAKVKPETPIQAVVRAYKHSKGVAKGNKAWDKSNFGRAAKAAQNLLACFDGNVDKCAVYIFKRAEDLNEKGLEWTLETISRHAFDGMGMTPRGENGHENGAVGADRLDGQRSTRRTTPSREIVGDALRAIEHSAVRAPGDGDVGGQRPDFSGDEDYAP
jgi:hypothetical protein